MKSIDMNKKYIGRSASIASFLSCQSQSLLRKKNILIGLFAAFVFSVLILPSSAFAIQNEQITFYSNGNPSIDLSGNSITHVRSQLTKSGTCGTGFNETILATTTLFNAINIFQAITSSQSAFQVGCNATSTISYWTCNPNSCVPVYANRYNHTSTYEKAWGEFVIVNGNVQGNEETPDDTSTRLTEFSPEQDEIIENSTTTISGTYYNQTPVYNKLIVNLSYVESSINTQFQLSESIAQQYIFNIATSTNFADFSTTTDELISGRWLVNAVFSNGTDGSNYFTATTSTFIVGTSTTFYSDFVYSTTTNYGEITGQCDSASGIDAIICWIGDRIGQTLQYLFIPNSTIIGLYQEDIASIKQRAPMIYAQQTPVLLDTLYQAAVNGTGTPISIDIKFIPGKGTSTLTFMSQSMLANTTLATTVKTIITGLLWLMFLLTVYKIVSSVYDDKTPNV